MRARVTPGSTAPFWDATLAALDSDGDGFTNGEELGDPDGDGVPIPGAEVTNPGDPTSKPTIVPPKPIENFAIASADAANATLTWSEGTGPFLVQRKGSLNDLFWQSSAATTDREMTVPLAGNAGFFRVFDLAAAPTNGLTVYLSGALQRPNPVSTTGSGIGHLLLEGDTLMFNIQYQGLSGAATAAHIHGPAPASANAGVLIDLAPFAIGGFTSSGVIAGSMDLTPEQKAALLAGQTYVNIHTAANPAGEIRGQIAPIHLGVGLHGAAARPSPVATAGSGSGVVTLIGNRLSFSIAYRNLSGTATAAHIHGPADGESTAGVMINLAPFNGGSFGASGRLAGSVELTPDQLAAVVDGLTYVNIHTAANPGGEIRGQIYPQVTGVPFSMTLSGDAQKPTPVTTTASGFGHAYLVGDVLYLELDYQNLSSPATAAHIHGPATTSQNAGVMINLAPYVRGGFGTTSGTIAGAIVLTEAQKAAVLAGQTYVNIHTGTNPAGEIRGQIAPVVLGVPLLSGGAVRPAPVTSDALGSAAMSLIGDRLTLSVLYSFFSTDVTAAHIHGPAGPDANAGVLLGLDAFNGGSFERMDHLNGETVLSRSVLEPLIDGMTYINIHSQAHPAGEIRGQIARP